MDPVIFHSTLVRGSCHWTYFDRSVICSYQFKGLNVIWHPVYSVFTWVQVQGYSASPLWKEEFLLYQCSHWLNPLKYSNTGIRKKSHTQLKNQTCSICKLSPGVSLSLGLVLFFSSTLPPLSSLAPSLPPVFAFPLNLLWLHYTLCQSPQWRLPLLSWALLSLQVLRPAPWAMLRLNFGS